MKLEKNGCNDYLERVGAGSHQVKWTTPPAYFEFRTAAASNGLSLRRNNGKCSSVEVGETEYTRKELRSTPPADGAVDHAWPASRLLRCVQGSPTSSSPTSASAMLRAEWTTAAPASSPLT